jgi:hypothetical protein
VADRIVKLGNSFCQFREGGVRRGNGSKELGTVACDGVDAQPGEDGAIRQHGDGGVEDHDELGSVFVLGERLVIAILSRKLGLEGGDDESDTAFVVKRIHRGIRVRMLLGHSIRINAAEDDGCTPLHNALGYRHLEIVRLLLDRGANVDAENVDGRTPLFLASSSGGTEIVHLLLDRGANAIAEDKYGWTPLHIASYGGERETVRLLLDRGANVDAENRDG